VEKRTSEEAGDEREEKGEENVRKEDTGTAIGDTKSTPRSLLSYLK